MHCANCRRVLRDTDTTGESGLYAHGDGINYVLCEPCFFEEEAVVEEAGHNDLPTRRTHYEVNQPGGIL